MNHTQPLPPIAVSVSQTCELLGLSRFTVNRLVKSGCIKSRKVGRRVLIPHESLLAFLQSGS